MRYIISGYGPGLGGVPKLIEYLSQKSGNNVSMIYPMTSKIKNYFFRKMIERIFFRVFFWIKLFKLKGKKVTLVHHQSIGFFMTKWLILNCKDPVIYVMDNGFFCSSAYNYISGEKSECLRCVGGDFFNADKMQCKVRPFGSTRRAHNHFQQWLLSHSSKVRFYTLSETNAKLLETHFKGACSAKPLYFMTNDLEVTNAKSAKSSLHEPLWDIVFHAADIPPKGIDYTIKLANKLPDYSFLIPSNKLVNCSKNVTLKDMRWETGLKGAVQNAKLVLTPSLWSYTPEAASLKSFKHNGKVAMIENKFGFTNEVPDGAYLSLSGDVDKDAEKIRDLFLNGDLLSLEVSGQDYYQQYVNRASKDMNFLLNDKI